MLLCAYAIRYLMSQCSFNIIKIKPCHFSFKSVIRNSTFVPRETSSIRMKHISICIICLFSVTNLFSDTINPPSRDRFSLKERLKERKRRIDFTLKSTDAFMDSLTGKQCGELDTLQILYMQVARKRHEEDAKIYWWVKVASLIILVLLALGFWVWKYRNKKGGMNA